MCKYVQHKHQHKKSTPKRSELASSRIICCWWWWWWWTTVAAKRSDYYKHGARVSAAFVAAAADADAAAAWKSSLRNNIIFMYGVRACACARVHACVCVLGKQQQKVPRAGAICFIWVYTSWSLELNSGPFSRAYTH